MTLHEGRTAGAVAAAAALATATVVAAGDSPVAGVLAGLTVFGAVVTTVRVTLTRR
ncbi:MAG TPA: hypothetical protein VGX28_03130 [Frankiaceae bacterium]|jgi:hypothetical protein|nr:hypothetical protein [Frankiaceae bacterium]